MEHTDAVKLQAVEKYILGTNPVLREEFEAHYFDCTACASTRTGVAFAAVSRQYCRIVGAGSGPGAPVAGLVCLAPAFNRSPVLAALLIVVGIKPDHDSELAPNN